MNLKERRKEGITLMQQKFPEFVYEEDRFNNYEFKHPGTGVRLCIDYVFSDTWDRTPTGLRLFIKSEFFTSVGFPMKKDGTFSWEKIRSKVDDLLKVAEEQVQIRNRQKETCELNKPICDRLDDLNQHATTQVYLNPSTKNEGKVFVRVSFTEECTEERATQIVKTLNELFTPVKA